MLNLHAGDVVAFLGYGADPIASENVVGGSDVVTLSDNTVIIFGGYDHKIFGGLQ